MKNRANIANEDEIDLLGLLNALVRLIKKNRYIIIGIIILSILVSFILYWMTAPFYRTRMIADSGTLPNTEIINIVDSWQNLINKGDYITFADKLNLDINTVSKVGKLKAQDTGTDNTELTPGNKNENSFMISAVVTDVQILDSLESAIINALESNEFVKRRSAIKKQNLESLRKKIATEIADLDSVKLAVRGLLNNGGPASGTFLTSPTEVNLRIVELYERILNIETSIKLSEDIQVIESFTKSTQPDGPTLIPYIFYGVISGLVLAVLFVAVRVISDKIKAYSESSIYSS